MQIPNNELLQQVELAKALGVSVRAIVNWREEGLPPAYHKPGSIVLFDLEKVHKWLIERKGKHRRRYPRLHLQYRSRKNGK